MPIETHFIFKKIYASWSTLSHGNIMTNWELILTKNYIFSDKRDNSAFYMTGQSDHWVSVERMNSAVPGWKCFWHFPNHGMPPAVFFFLSFISSCRVYQAGRPLLILAQVVRIPFMDQSSTTHKLIVTTEGIQSLFKTVQTHASTAICTGAETEPLFISVKCLYLLKCLRLHVTSTSRDLLL